VVCPLGGVTFWGGGGGPPPPPLPVPRALSGPQESSSDSSHPRRESVTSVGLALLELAGGPCPAVFTGALPAGPDLRDQSLEACDQIRPQEVRHVFREMSSAGFTLLWKRGPFIVGLIECPLHLPEKGTARKQIAASHCLGAPHRGPGSGLFPCSMHHLICGASPSRGLKLPPPM
jgi:hypothetical protein